MRKNHEQAVTELENQSAVECFGGKVQPVGDSTIVFVDSDGHSFATAFKTGANKMVLCITTNKEDITLRDCDNNKNPETNILPTEKVLPQFILEATQMFGLEQKKKDRDIEIDIQMIVKNNKFKYTMLHAISAIKDGSYIRQCQLN